MQVLFLINTFSFVQDDVKNIKQNCYFFSFMRILKKESMHIVQIWNFDFALCNKAYLR